MHEMDGEDWKKKTVARHGGSSPHLLLHRRRRCYAILQLVTSIKGVRITTKEGCTF